MARVLFLTWDGPGQTYLPSLFLPILAGLRAHAFDIDVLQYTWADQGEVARTAAAAERVGIGYRRRTVWRGSVSVGAAAAIVSGGTRLAQLLRREEYRLVLARSIIPAGMALAALRGEAKTRLVFDADGLPADERVDFAGWSPGGARYRVFRELEAQGVRTAPSVIVRTSHAKEILLHRAGAGTDAGKLFVIPNAKDEQVFAPGTPDERGATRLRLGIPADAPWIVYVGSIGPQYHLPEMLKLFGEIRARRDDARMSVFTAATGAVREAARRAGFPDETVEARPLPPEEVPACLAAADLGLALRQPSFSQLAVSPIKLAEYLLCGLPVVATAGVGDVDEHVISDTGHLLSDVREASLEQAARWFLGKVLPARAEFRERCRGQGIRHFALRSCVDRYAAALLRAGS